MKFIEKMFGAPEREEKVEQSEEQAEERAELSPEAERKQAVESIMLGQVFEIGSREKTYMLKDGGETVLLMPLVDEHEDSALAEIDKNDGTIVKIDDGVEPESVDRILREMRESSGSAG